jgi:hypothetical protein
VNSCLDRKRKLRRLLPLADKLIRDVPSAETNTIDDLLRSERTGMCARHRELCRPIITTLPLAN